MTKHSPFSRRAFLKTSAAVGAIAASPTAAGTVLGDRPIPKAPQKGPIPEGQPVRVGFIGLGGMGGGHLGSLLKQIKDGAVHAEVVGIAEVNQFRRDDARSRAEKEQEGVEVTGYVDYREMLERDDVDCVLIATPEHWHATMAVDAIAAGKDVYVEKPMTLRLDEALWMYKVMDANPHMRLQVGTQYMMWPRYVEAKRLIAAGAIGHPTFSQTSYCRNSPNGEWTYYGIDDRLKPGENLDWERWCGPLGLIDWNPYLYARWRRYRDYSTGIIGDLLVHVMTPMVYATDRGWPTRVVATGGHYVDKAMENHDQINLSVDFELEHTMFVAGSTCNATGVEQMIRGHEANLQLGGDDCVLVPERPFAEDIDPKTVQCQRVDEQPELRKNWIECVRSREMNRSTVELGTKVMVIVDLATRSIWDGGAWTFDPETMKAKRA